MSLWRIARKSIGPKANIQAHRLFDRRRITFSTNFDSKSLASLFISLGRYLRCAGPRRCRHAASIAAVGGCHRSPRGFVGTTLGHQVDHAMDLTGRYPFSVAVLLRPLGTRSLVDQRVKTAESLEDCQPLDAKFFPGNDGDYQYQSDGGGRRGAA